MLDPRRSFTAWQRQWIWMASGGRCEGCGVELTYSDFHCDHIWPHSRGGRTVLSNAQALCAGCNREKSARMDVSRYFRRATPRKWQAEFLEAFAEAAPMMPSREEQGFLLYATPGAGKTVAMCAAATFLRENGWISWLVIVVPSEPLCGQVAKEAKALFDLDLRHGRDGVDSLFDGEVVTIQSLRNRKRDSITRREGRVLLCVDEFHHPSSSNSWGEDLERALGGCKFKLFCTGTPFRSDRDELKFVRYNILGNGELELMPDYAYQYKDALRDSTRLEDGSPTPSSQRIVRPACFHLYDCHDDDDLIEWEINGDRYAHRLSDNLAAIYEGAASNMTQFVDSLRSYRFDAAIDIRFQLARRMLRDAVTQLDEIRKSHGHAGGLVVCKDKRSADAVAEFMRRDLGVKPVVVYQGSQGGTSTRQIGDFRKHDSPHKWIVAVQQVSEGVDIKRLRVCVWLTNKKTHLIFLQILGRIIRWEHTQIGDRVITPPLDQLAHMYIPAQGSDTFDKDDPIELVKYAKEIEADVSLIINPVARRNCVVCGDMPASFGSGNCVSSQQCPFFRNSGGGTVNRVDRQLLGAGGHEQDAILRGEYYDPQILSSLESRARHYGLPVDAYLQLLREMEQDEFARDKAIAERQAGVRTEQVASAIGVSTAEATVMTVSDQLSELKANIQRKVGRLVALMARKGAWADDDPRRQTAYQNIHKRWARLSGSTTKDASINNLMSKSNWLDNKIQMYEDDAKLGGLSDGR